MPTPAPNAMRREFASIRTGKASPALRGRTEQNLGILANIQGALAEALAEGAVLLDDGELDLAMRAADVAIWTSEPQQGDLDIAAAVHKLRELYGQAPPETIRHSRSYAETWPEPKSPS